MINADKYKISVEESDRMSDEFEKWHQDNPDVRGYGEALYRFLQAKTKPTLSEDEKVILKNIQLYTGNPVIIRRIWDGHLQISGGCGNIDFVEYNHLFDFIKERRRI